MEGHTQQLGGLPDKCKDKVVRKRVQTDDVLTYRNGQSQRSDGPPDGFLLVLPFLDLQSRLTMERACKSMREAVKDNPVIWQDLRIEWPASRGLSDDILLTLAKRADGRLMSLSLVGCLRVTETALEQVLALNPGLEKLAVPGCTGLAVPGCTGISAAAIVRFVELHSVKSRAQGNSGIKALRIRGLYNITKEQLDLLQTVGIHNPKRMKRQLYGNDVDGLADNDERPIDVEVCPNCENIRVVYDCTRHPFTEDGEFGCRGCTFCIPRCEECGRCIGSEPSYDHTSCSDLVCTSCWSSLPKCCYCNRAVCSRHGREFFIQEDNTFTCEACCAAEEEGFEDWMV